jgi:hypothetical protein
VPPTAALSRQQAPACAPVRSGPDRPCIRAGGVVEHADPPTPHRTRCKLVTKRGCLPPSHAPARLWRKGRRSSCCGTRDPRSQARTAPALAASRCACKRRTREGACIGLILPYPTLSGAHLHLLAVGERDPARHVAQRRAQALAPRRQVQLRAGAAPAQPRVRRRCETGCTRAPRPRRSCAGLQLCQPASLQQQQLATRAPRHARRDDLCRLQPPRSIYGRGSHARMQRPRCAPRQVQAGRAPQRCARWRGGGGAHKVAEQLLLAAVGVEEVAVAHAQARAHQLRARSARPAEARARRRRCPQAGPALPACGAGRLGSSGAPDGMFSAGARSPLPEETGGRGGREGGARGARGRAPGTCPGPARPGAPT